VAPRVDGRPMVWLRQTFLLLLPIFSLVALGFAFGFSKIKCLLSIYICINFYPYSFDYFDFNVF